MANKYISRYADTVGDGSGFISALGEYTLEAPQIFAVQVPADKRFAITRMIVYIEDTYTGQFDPSGYGGMDALSNGIEVQVLDKNLNVLLDLTDGVPIKTNGQWQRVCYDASGMVGSGNVSLGVRWTFDRAVPQSYGELAKTPIVLQDDMIFAVTCQDDLSDLVDHTFLLQGVELNAPAILGA